MATIQSILEFQDKMSAVISKVANTLDNATSNMTAAKTSLEQLEYEQNEWKKTLDAANNSAVKNAENIEYAQKKYDEATNAINKTKSEIEKYEKVIQQSQSQVDKIAQEQNTFNNALNNTNNAANNASNGLNSMQGKIITLASAFQLFNQVKGFIQGVNAKINEFINYTQIQMQAEDQLSIITKQRMGLTDNEIRSLYNLAAAQQRIGVVGDEETITGMANLAMFAKQKSTIEALTPAMNNLAVKAYGYNVTAESMRDIGLKLGKVLAGDVSALSRMGVKIDENQKKWLMSLNEQQRAVELAKIITNVTGDMNEAFAKTPLGQITQANKKLGDSYERLGNLLIPIQSLFVTTWSKMVSATVSALEKIVSITASLIDPFAKIFITAFAGIATYATTYYGILVAKTIWAAGVTAAQWTAAWLQTIMATREVITTNIIASTQTAIAWLKNIPILLQNAIAMGVIQIQSILAGKAAFAAGLKAAGGWLLAQAPLLATIAVVGLLSYAFIKLNKSVEDVLNFVIDKFIDMGKTVLSVLQSIAQGIDNVFHTNLSSSIGGMIDNLEKGREKAHKATAKLQGGINTVADNIRSITNPRALLGATGQTGLESLTTSTSGGKALKTQNQGEIEINGEDLQLLHDMATRDYMVNYQQQNLTPQVNLPNVVIHETADVDSVVESLVSAVTDLAQSKLVRA